MVDVSQFLAAVLPTQGFRYVAAFFPDSDRPVHRDFDALDGSLEGYARWADTQRGGDVYIAVGGYLPGDDGRMRRTAACARWHRSLRLDLDVGEGKDYASKRDAVAALQAFIEAYRLPKPWLVDSGYGIHVYWALDRDVPLEEWLQLAAHLKGGAEAHGLRVDATTTIDAARILRMPGTTNRKYNDTRPVRILCANPAMSPDVFRALPLPLSGVPTVGMSRGAAVSELSANLRPPYFLRGVLTRCPGMLAMVANKGATATEPLWKATLDLVNKAADDEAVKWKVAKGLSCGHPGYDEGALANKWAQTQQQDYEPPTCARMQSLGMTQCLTCPVRGSVASPVVLGRPVAVLADMSPAPPASPPAPAPLTPPAPQPPPAAPSPAAPVAPQISGVFMHTPGVGKVQVIDGLLTKDLAIHNGLPCQRLVKKDKQGNVLEEWWRPIIKYRIVEVERMLDRQGSHSITTITVDRYTDGPATIELSHGDLGELRAFANKLIAAGLHVERKDVAFLQDTFMTYFLHQLQRIQQANQIASNCGWTEDGRGFVLGTMLHTAGATTSIRPTADAKSEMEAYHQQGDEALWRKAFDIALSGGPDRQIVAALSIAAPLMQFSGVDGLILNAYSPESGVGKTTLGDAALSIWGAPNKLRKSFRDTANATFKMAAIDGNLPIVADEFTNVEGRALSDYVYTITQGREKHRLGADAGLKASSARWCLPAITTSNNSIHEKLQDFRRDAVAEAARVFELKLSPLQISASQMQHDKQALSALDRHYGFLGPRIIQLLLQRSGAEWRTTVANRVAYWDRTMARDASDRFRSVCAALVEIGAAIGKSMGYPFDTQAIHDALKSQWAMQQTEFDSQKLGPEELVNGYIVKNIGEFTTIGGANGDQLTSAIPRRVMGEIRGRAAGGKSHVEFVVIPLDMLREYAREKNLSFKVLQDWIKTELESPTGCVTRVGRLTFLKGLLQQVTTQAVEFKHSVLGGATLTVVSDVGTSQEAANA